jgi:Leucine-rich repeat (LRR) protein
MKKFIITFMLVTSLILTPMFAAQPATAAYANEDNSVIIFDDATFHGPPIRVRVDGQPVLFTDRNPVIIDGRTLVPIRDVFEFVGFVVEWDGVARQAVLTSDDYEIVVTIGSDSFTTNGAAHTLDVPARIIEGRTMLPIRALLENVGYYVSWDSRQRIVLVSSEPITYVTIRGEQLSSALTELNLSEMNLTDEEIAPLAGLTNLTELNLRSNGISDLTPLASLNNLTRLDLESNRISDVSPLANLTNLTNLFLHNNRISDITPLANLTNLERLNFAINNINDISALANLVNLRSLDFSGNITDISPISDLTRLEILFITSSQVSDIKPLADLTNLRLLNLERNQISDISPLANMTNLEWLLLNNNEISDISPLVGMVKLDALFLENNQISDITPLAELTNLTSFLILSNNQISDITPLQNLTNSNWFILSLDDNPITDWSPVDHIELVGGRP